MRVLVTGHKGFIGSVMVPMLQGRGVEVVGMDTDYYRDCTFAGSLADIPEVRCDIRDASEEDFAGFDAVFHLAALSNDPLGDFDPEITYGINHHATILLARLARRAGVPRFVFSSSCSNYGTGGDALLDETAPFNPVTPIWDLQGSSRAGPTGAGRRRLQSGPLAQRHRIRRLTRDCVATSCSTT